jgi:hypothetical protein
LLVVNHDVLVLLTFRSGSAGIDGPAFAIGRYDNATSDSDLATFRNGEFHRPVVNLGICPGILVRVAGDRIIFPVELAGPLAVRRFGVRVDTVRRHFHLAEHAAIANPSVFPVPGVIFDLALFSFQVPICGSAARHAAAPKKQNARVNPIGLIFMRSIETGFRRLVNTFQT